MMQGQLFLKGWGRGLALFLSDFFKVYDFLYLEITVNFGKLCYGFEEILFFSATIVLRKKSHSKLFQNEPESTP